MEYYRFSVDGAVPKDVYDALPVATKTAIRDKMRQLKSFCKKINEGLPTEENSVRFKWHTCRHEDNQLCGDEQDI